MSEEPDPDDELPLPDLPDLPGLPEAAAEPSQAGPPSHAGSAPPSPEPQEEDRRFRVRLQVNPRTAAGLVGFLALGFCCWSFLYTPEIEGFPAYEGGDGDAVVILFHGYGASGDDLVPLGEEIADAVPQIRFVALEAPTNVGLGGRSWYMQDRERPELTRRLAAVVDSLEDDGTPASRMVAIGFSQGAAVAADLARARPELAGAALLSGAHPPGDGPLTGHLFVSHGRGDPVLSFGAAERSVELYREHADVEMIAFDGGHAIPPEVREGLFDWLRRTLRP